MPVTTLNLPVPAADGVGAWVDVSSIAPERTISIDVGANFEGELFVDAACTAGAAPVDPLQFTPVLRFDSTTQRKTTILLACNFLRVRRRFTRPENPTVPVVNVGGDTAGASVFGVLAVTAGNGLGAPLDISAGGAVLTILTAGTFDRAVYIEGSQDAGTTFARIEDFGKFESSQGKTALCSFERVRVASEKSRSGDSPIVMVGSMAESAAALAFGSIVSVDADPNVDGVAATASRADHKHEVLTAAPTGTVEIGDAGAEGVASQLARADHVHPVGDPGAPPNIAAVSDEGVSVIPARSDHTHGDISSTLQTRNYFADQLIIPNSDWPVTALAPSDLDTTTPSFTIIEHDDTTEEGRGFATRVPSAAVHGVDPTTFNLGIVHKAPAAPPAERTVGVRLYFRTLPDNGAVPAWASIDLGDVTVPANVNFQYDEFTLTIGAGVGELDVTPGEDVYFMVTRIDPAAGTELVGDWYVGEYQERWES